MSVRESNLVDFNDPQFSNWMIWPECDQKIPKPKKLDLTPGVIRLGVIPDLVGILRELEEQADQPPLLGFRKSDKECRGFGREDRFVG